MMRCKFIEYAPHTDDGWQTWDVLKRCQSQLRTIGMGTVIGLDMNAVISTSEALGYNTAAVAELIGFGEAGMMEAIQESKPSDG